ncbi:PREDICTED: GRAM domain-containing protein 2-like isoform X1 [Crocodylus porosus]|uniref:GRAM domain-containing protein 3-like n=1 Tax=Crocodylus porosus TaxID=8502 RepID=A0A7M4F090_CROPO|nr:PREDICTED: GRAM domain-containing protein 2-like isoform X1 [Crocodylus porosus]
MELLRARRSELEPGAAGMIKLGVRAGPGISAFPVTSCLANPAVPSGKAKKSKKKVLEQKKWQSLEETRSEVSQPGKHALLARSKTYDPSYSKEPEKDLVLGKQKNSSSSLVKRMVSFHKAFKDIPEEEALLDSFSCAWQKEVPYHGRLYVSQNYICFHCSMLLKDVKVVIPVSSIAIFKKANTALLVPNALSIRTVEGEKFLFVSLRTREATYQLLRSVCKHPEDESRNSSPTATPTIASPEHLLKKPLTSSQSDLEHNPQETDSLLDTPDGPRPKQNRMKEDVGKRSAALSKGGTGVIGQTKVTTSSWWSQLSTLNVVILIYLLLVVILLLSSGYIGLRIVELEQQLTSMGAWPELNLERQYKKT